MRIWGSGVGGRGRGARRRGGGGGGIKGFSDRAEKDTTGYRNPKMAEVPTSRLEGIIPTPGRNATTDSTETSVFSEHSQSGEKTRTRTQ